MSIQPDIKIILGLKECYALIYAYYKYNPELLKDLTTSCLYQSLMAVNTADDLDRWMKAVAKTDFSLGEIRWDTQADDVSPLSYFDYSLRRLSSEERAIFVEEIVKQREAGFDRLLNEDLPTLVRESEEAHRKYPSSLVVLYDAADNLMAVGDDADRLFEQFGWQTAVAQADGLEVSVMPVCREMLQVEGLINAQLVETSVIQTDIVVTDPSDLRLSFDQQVIEAFRRSLSDDERDLVFHIDTIHQESPDGNMGAATDYLFIEVKGDTFSLLSSEAIRHTLVAGQSWFVNKEMIPLLDAVTERLFPLMVNKDLRSKTIGVTGVLKSTLRAMGSYDDFLKEKESCGGKLLLIDYGSFRLSYGDDAVLLAKRFYLPLWTRDCGTHGQQPVLLVTEDIKKYVQGISEITIRKSIRQDEWKDLRLQPSALNRTLYLDELFHDGSLFQKKDGTYAVRASYQNRVLPMKPVNKDDAEQYLYMKGELAKRTFLNGLLYEVYVLKAEDGEKQKKA